MAIVNVMVNGRSYTLACDDGEEGHLREMAAYVDSKISELAGTVGQLGDVRLLLMAALLIADERATAVEKLKLRKEEAAAAEDDPAPLLDSAAQRLEELAVRLARA